MRTWPIALQMWSLADLREKDLAGSFKALSEMGFHGVEGCFNNWPDPDELNKLLDDTNLQMCSAHINYGQLIKDTDSVCEYFDRLGMYYLVIPTASFGLYPEGTSWEKRIEDMSIVADKLAGTKFTLAFHNHDHEFKEMCGDKEAHDAIFETIAPEKLRVQMDTFFVQSVGRKPGDYIRRYAGRQELLHLKEQPVQPSEYTNTEIGYGTIDWNDVFAAAETADIKWCIIEQKCEQYDPITSAKRSIEFLKSKGVVAAK